MPAPRIRPPGRRRGLQSPGMIPEATQRALAVVVSGVFGLLIGSFLNVVIYRVPRGLSVVRPPSHCPHCDTELGALDNLPLVSWLALRGRCRYCGAPDLPPLSDRRAGHRAGLRRHGLVGRLLVAPGPPAGGGGHRRRLGRDRRRRAPSALVPGPGRGHRGAGPGGGGRGRRPARPPLVGRRRRVRRPGRRPHRGAQRLRAPPGSRAGRRSAGRPAGCGRRRDRRPACGSWWPAWPAWPWPAGAERLARPPGPTWREGPRRLLDRRPTTPLPPSPDGPGEPAPVAQALAPAQAVARLAGWAGCYGLLVAAALSSAKL